MDQDIRWKQRFNNFKRAYYLLGEALENDLDKLSQLEKEGIIKRFEYTFELAWKVLKDKMEYDGLIVDKISPKSVARKAYESKYINNLDIWFRMIGDRNLMSHTYDFSKFEVVIRSIKDEYYNIFSDLYSDLMDDLI